MESGEQLSRTRVQIELFVEKDDIPYFISNWESVKDALIAFARINSAKMIMPIEVKEIDLTTF